MSDEVARRRQNTEQVLLALFDAHGRVQMDLKRVIDETEPNSDARKAAMDARDTASHQIADCAVDRVAHELEMLDEWGGSD